MNRIEAAVRHYKSHYLHNIQGLLEWYASLDSLDEAIDNASLGKDERGKRHPHQRRLEELKMLRARYYLLGYRERISSLSSFNDLLDIVESVTDRVEGLGELYAYDTALRIGSFIGVLPEKVYLHAGARVGAKALGVDGKVKAIELRSLPVPFHSLEPHQAEDALCIYKKLLRRS
jgi:hypothetical protein